MRITSLGHAGFCVETSQATIIMDPWLSPDGAFDAGWFQLPRNHHLRELVEDKLSAAGRQKFIYISHEHQDHLDLELLRSLRSRDFTLLIARFQRPALLSELASVACQAIRVCGDGDSLPLPDGGSVQLFVDDAGLNRDSAILVTADGQTFLNANDCKLYDRLSEIVAHTGPLDVFTCQFSGATWHPTCYAYPPAEYARISRQKMLSKFESVAHAIEVTSPRIYLPSAGPACFLDPDLIDLNFQAVNIFPRAEKFQAYLRRRMPTSETRWPALNPGDVLDVESGEITVRDDHEHPIDEAHFEPYIRRYAAAYTDHFAALKHAPDRQAPTDVLDRLRLELLRKLDHFSLGSRMSSNLSFGLTDAPDQVLSVDFQRGTVERARRSDEPPYYAISAPSWQVQRTLDRRMTWEDFALTFRARLDRQPDLYQTTIQGFLILEAEDLDWFCTKLIDFQTDADRAVVRVDGRRYSITRRCPHQGADLRHGRSGDPGCWVCPRHGWQFALDRGGACTTNDTTIDAVALEELTPQ
jgi:UDP-MurNAc hydroxylase